MLGACALGCVRVAEATAVSALRAKAAMIGSCDDRSTRITNNAPREIIRTVRGISRPYFPAHATSAWIEFSSLRPWVAGGALAQGVGKGAVVLRPAVDNKCADE